MGSDLYQSKITRQMYKYLGISETIDICTYFGTLKCLDCQYTQWIPKLDCDPPDSCAKCPVRMQCPCGNNAFRVQLQRGCPAVLTEYCLTCPFQDCQPVKNCRPPWDCVTCAHQAHCPCGSMNELFRLLTSNGHLQNSTSEGTGIERGDLGDGNGNGR